MVRLMEAGHVPGAAAAHAVALRALLPGLNDSRMAAQSQIVVTRKIAVALALVDKPGGVAFPDDPGTQGVYRPAFVKGGCDALLPAHTTAAL